MSISGALYNAVSGLKAVSKGSEIVSANLSNALTPGYGRREVALSSQTIGSSGGVRIDGITRQVSAGLVADNRLALAGLGMAEAEAGFFNRIETEVGLATNANSLNGLLASFDSALIAASARPDSELRLTGVVDAATALTSKINSISDTIQTARSEADKQIGTSIDRLNSALSQVAELNRQVTITEANGRDASSLKDERQKVIDEIASIVPLREVMRENGRVSLYAESGLTLLDGTTPASFEFSAQNVVTAGMSVAGGTLSVLSVNGKELTGKQADLMAGGELGALFNIRDNLAPAMQQQIDGFARDVYERFADPAVDTTLAAGDAGLFVEQGNTAFDPANEVGFAGRISVNSAVIASEGGDVWRIRTGINAADEGNVGASAQLDRFTSVISAARDPQSASAASGQISLTGYAGNILSYASTNRVQFEASQTRSQTLADTLQSALYAEGVDTDAEMEKLLQLEKAYTANAKVIAAAMAMLDSILSI